MSVAILLALLHVTLWATSADAAAPSIVDDRGKTITLAAPAEHVIALYGAFNEILAAIGEEDVLIGRTKADVTPPSIAALPSIGTHMRPNTELVVGMGPDIVLQMGGRKQALRSVQELEQFGIPVAFFSVSSFDELFSVISRVGILVGKQGHAEALVTRLKARLDAVHAIVSQAAHKPSVFFEVRYPNLLGAGKASIVSDIIRRAGGQNILTVDKKLVRLNEEELLRLDPEIYLIQHGPMNPNPRPLKNRAHFQSLQALHSQRYMRIDEHMYSRPGPRAVDAVEDLARFIHADQFK